MPSAKMSLTAGEFGVGGFGVWVGGFGVWVGGCGVWSCVLHFPTERDRRNTKGGRTAERFHPNGVVELAERSFRNNGREKSVWRAAVR